MTSHLDGNALAGPLADFFSFDVTTATGRCADAAPSPSSPGRWSTSAAPARSCAARRATTCSRCSSTPAIAHGSTSPASARSRCAGLAVLSAGSEAAPAGAAAWCGSADRVRPAARRRALAEGEARRQRPMLADLRRATEASVAEVGRAGPAPSRRGARRRGGGVGRRAGHRRPRPRRAARRRAPGVHALLSARRSDALRRGDDD